MRNDIEKEIDRQLVRYIIQRSIFCPVTGKVLDIRTAKYFVDGDGDPAYVVSPEVYDAAVAAPHILESLAEKGLFPNE